MWEDIRQLIISPNNDLIAILTSHTVHVAVLPDPSHLHASDTGPIRLKAYMVGSTTHVLSQPALASAVWHPLGVSGHCLVTTTVEAIVRVWEFDIENRWSFDSPRLTIDLKHLADGLPQEQDAGPNKLSSSKVFSPDLVEMEVAATCFGGDASRLQDPWAPMTLWIAMREGDVYALCPLLPARWVAPAWLVPSLGTSIATNVSLATSDPSIPGSERLMFERQLDWITEIEEEKLILRSSRGRGDSSQPVYQRPQEVGSIPKLQGPFAMSTPLEESHPEAECLLTDIYVISATLDADQQATVRRMGFRDHARDRQGMSWGVVSLLSSTGRVLIFLDSQGIQGDWPVEDVGVHRP